MTKGMKWVSFSIVFFTMIVMWLFVLDDESITLDRVDLAVGVSGLLWAAVGAMYIYGMLKGLNGINAESWQPSLEAERKKAEKLVKKYHLSGDDQGSPHEQ